MTGRKKLIELLNKAHAEYYAKCDFSKGYMETLADSLLANGVTFATDTNVDCEWISVADRLPTVDDADEVDHIMAIIKGDEFAQIFCWRSIVNLPEVFTHWMPLPTPPLGTTNQVADL